MIGHMETDEDQSSFKTLLVFFNKTTVYLCAQIKGILADMSDWRFQTGLYYSTALGFVNMCMLWNWVISRFIYLYVIREISVTFFYME